jgi:hypothetical protein
MSWKDMGLGCAMQYDDDDIQIQVTGAGNEFWKLPNWIVEFWCKKEGCGAHMAGPMPKGTPYKDIVEKCKSSHTECDIGSDEEAHSESGIAERRTRKKAEEDSLSASKASKAKRTEKKPAAKRIVGKKQRG